MRSRLLLAACATLIPAVALATVVIEQSFEEMAKVAPVIVRGTVHQSQAARDPSESGIWTYTEIIVSETLKGKPTGALLVKQPGGIVGRVGAHVEGTAKFTEGEDVLVFLEVSPDEPSMYVVLGLAAGKVSFEDQRGTLQAIRRTDGLGFAAPGGQSVKRVDAVQNLGTADAFLARIRKAVGAGSKR